MRQTLALVLMLGAMGAAWGAGPPDRQTWERFGKIEEATNGYLRVLSIDPADDEALAAMDALYRRTERFTDLIGVFRRRIELAAETADRETL